jgi:hypothetical protein
MPDARVAGTTDFGLPQRPSLLEDLSRRLLDEPSRLTYEREMLQHYIAMLETELRAARQVLDSLGDVSRPDTGTVKRAVRVTLAVYSGRPDPTWALSEREVEELRRLLDRGLRTPLREAPKPPGLGYAGFVIENEAGARGIPRRLQVYRGVATVTGAAGEWEPPRLYRDERRIEMWLAEQAVNRGHGDAMAHFGGPRVSGTPPGGPVVAE